MVCNGFGTMTAMKPLRPAWLRRFGGRRIWRWTAAGLAVLLIPKCIACALASGSCRVWRASSCSA
jgi:hypothetical protein